jgi:DNA-binding transcriptional MerR regulator
MAEATNAPMAYFTTGQVARLTGLSHRQLDHWAWSGFLVPSGGEGAPSAFARRRYTFEDLVRIRTVAELRRQGAPLQLVRKAVERLRQFTVDPLRQLKLVVLDGEVYVYRSWAELERATDGQLAFTLVDVGAVLRQLEGQLATLRPRSGRRRAPTETPSVAAG